MADHIHLLISVNKRQDVSLVINQMKGFVSKKAGFSLWQRSYYDHIIRDEQDYLEKWQRTSQSLPLHNILATLLSLCVTRKSAGITTIKGIR
jgi:hypothetical protein